MVLKLVVLLVEKKRLAVVVRVVAIAGSSTVDVAPVPLIIQVLFPWHKASTLDKIFQLFHVAVINLMRVKRKNALLIIIKVGDSKRAQDHYWLLWRELMMSLRGI